MKRISRSFIAILLALFIVLPIIPANATALEITEVEIVNDAKQKYLSLLEGNYSNYELRERYIELFGNTQTHEYIRQNYEEIFGLNEGELIDKAFLDIITEYREDFSVTQSRDANGLLESRTHRSLIDIEGDLQFINSIPSDDMPSFEPESSDELTVQYPEGTFEEVEAESNATNSGLIASQADDSFDLEDSPSFAPAMSPSNSFTSISLVSKTDTSITFDIWFKSGDDVNNYLKKYDTVSWTTLLGQGTGTATSRRYTATGLKPGWVYKFETGKYDWASSSWQKSELIVETTGAKTQALSFVSATANSITVQAQYPAEGIWGNTLKYYDSLTSTWVSFGGTDLYQNSGTYTLSGLIPGVTYRIYLSSYDHMTKSWREQIYQNINTVLPAENILSYSKSNIDFKLDKLFTDTLGSTLTNSFLTNTNAGYASMYNLVGGNTTYSSGRMEIKHIRNNAQSFEGMSGWPITWQFVNVNYPYNYALDHAIKMKALNVSTTETPFHEISHNFDNYKWVFEAEALAILKIYYHYSITNQTMAVSNQAISFTGGDYKNYMKSYANRINGHINYDAAMAQGVYSPYSLAYTLSDIADEIGWTAFTNTFTYFYNLPYTDVPTTQLGKFNLFLTKLSDYSGQDVVAMLSAQERTVYEDYFGGNIRNLNTTSTLAWPTDSGEVTLWYGQIDQLYNAVHQSIDIQGEIGDEIRAISDGVVVYNGTHSYYGNVLYINTVIDGEHIQVRYANLSTLPNYSIGQSITKGMLIGTMKEATYGKGLVEITMLKSTNGLPCETNNSNTVTIDPMLYLEKPECDESFLEYPMATTIDITGSSLSQMTPFFIWPWEDANNPDVRYRENLDLEDGENYLRKIVLEYAVRFDRKAKQDNLESKGILVYNSATQIATVTLNGRVVNYGVSLGNARIVNNRMVVGRDAFWYDIIGSRVNSDVLGSTAYLDHLTYLMDEYVASEGWKYGNNGYIITAGRAIEIMKRDVENYADVSTISDGNWRAFCNKFNSYVRLYGAVNKETHYFRNRLNRAPQSLDALIAYNLSASSATRWRLMEVGESLYHMYGTLGGYNVKFVSYDGIYEAVYDKNGVLLTENNAPVNMGTYNYYPSELSLVNHGIFDVVPYELWNNSANDPGSTETLTQNEAKYNNDPAAVSHRQSIIDRLP